MIPLKTIYCKEMWLTSLLVINSQIASWSIAGIPMVSNQFGWLSFLRQTFNDLIQLAFEQTVSLRDNQWLSKGNIIPDNLILFEYTWILHKYIENKIYLIR